MAQWRRDTEGDGRDAEESNERNYEELSAPHKTNPPANTRRRITLEELAQTVRLSTVLRSSNQ